jgi:hypothetical protein
MTAAPTTGAELVDALGSSGPVFDDNAKAALRAYVDSAVQDSAIQTQVREQAQAVFAEFL